MIYNNYNLYEPLKLYEGKLGIEETNIQVTHLLANDGLC